jgi:hypothetical protein
MPLPNELPTHAELHVMDPSTIFDKIDAVQGSSPKAWKGVQALIYRDELQRRETKSSTEAMLGLTNQVKRMTVIMTVATVLILIATIINVIIVARS